MPRIDSRGYPLRAKDGQRVDDLGRVVDRDGDPVDDDGKPLTDPDGRPLPRATRTPICKVAAKEYDLAHATSTAPGTAAAAARCASSSTAARTRAARINGDGALTGYCYAGRKVFCVMYFQTKVPC